MTDKEKKKSPSLQATLTPAYGRDYGGKAETIDSFKIGKDFVFNLMGQSTYVSIEAYNAGDMVKIRYDKLTKVAFYRITEYDLLRK